MEALTMIAISALIIFVYTIDWHWVMTKAFDIIGGCDEN